MQHNKETCIRCNESKVKEYDFYRTKTQYWGDENGRRWQRNVCPQCALKPKTPILNICNYCNIEFTTYHRTSKVCSSKCRKKLLDKETGYSFKYNRSKSKTGDRYVDCIICNTNFHTRFAHKKTCSDECSKKNQVLNTKNHIKNKRKLKRTLRPPKVIKSPKICLVCPNIIIRGKYCFDHTPKYKKVSHNKICVTCGNNYISKSKKSVYCKPNCSPSKRLRKRIEKFRDIPNMPKWVNKDELKEILELRPSKDYHLDHIVPLNGELVSGLHVPWNLQWLTKEDNLLKSNRFDGTYENESWKNLKNY